MTTTSRPKKRRTRRKIKILDVQCVETPRGEICTGAFMPSKLKTLRTRDYNPKKRTLRKESHSKAMKKKKKSKKPTRTKSVLSKSVSIKSAQKIEAKNIKRKKARTQQQTTGQVKPVKKMSSKIRISRPKSVKVPKALNDELISLLGRLEDLMKMDGEVHRARAYHNAMESIMRYPDPIYDVNVLKGYAAIGSTILSKFNEYIKTGKLRKLERAKGKPVYEIVKVYGIGPKRARQLVNDDGITSIAELRERQDELLNATQRKGLLYYDDLLKRIPRAEIDQYKEIFAEVFESIPHADSNFEIVGSYRRGAQNSGDIDVIITNSNNDSGIFKRFIAALQKHGIIVEILSKGRTKSFAIGQLPGEPARRVDFMYSSPDQYAFAILYFTGSKAFNVVQRERAIDLGYTMNEHGLHELIGDGKKKKKGPAVDQPFPDERSIFDFLGLVYKAPAERKSGKDVVLKDQSATSKSPTPPAATPPVAVQTPTPVSKAKSVKRKKSKIKIARPRGTIRITHGKKVKTPRGKPKKTIRKMWKDVETGGIVEIKKFTELDLCNMVRAAGKAYHNNKAFVSDSIYDLLKEYGERTFPENPCWAEVGTAPEKQKVRLPYFMGSMDKIKPDTAALSKWKKKYGKRRSKVVVSGKLDGISALFTTEGDEPKLYTRGGGTEGVDISYMIPYLDLPKEKGITLRGELLIATETFNAKWKGPKEEGLYKNPRNFVGGVARYPEDAAKRPEPEKWADLDLVSYEVIKPILKPSAQLQWLEDHGVITVIHKEMATKDVTNAMLSEILVDWRDSYKYEIDGIIVVDDKIWPRKKENPKHAFAFKMVLNDQMAEAKVVDVIWTASKDGLLKPVVQIEPVHIRGADIEFATANNAKNVEENDIGIGAIVLMIRSGDVIPKIEKVVVPAEKPKMPSVPWKWNESHVEAVVLDAATNVSVRTKAIEYFFTKLKVAGVGPGNVTRIVKAGYDTIPEILKMSIEDLLKIHGFKQKTAKKIHQGIRDKIDEASLPRLMAATNVFGRGLGRTIIKLILDNHPNILTSSESDEEKIRLVTSVKGLGKKRAKGFVSHIQDFLDFIVETGLEQKLTHTPKEIDTSHILHGKKIVMTGLRDEALKADIEAKTGTSMATDVTENTFIVIAKEMTKKTRKYNEAEQLGITIMLPTEFAKKYL